MKSLASTFVFLVILTIGYSQRLYVMNSSPCPIEVRVYKSIGGICPSGTPSLSTITVVIPPTMTPIPIDDITGTTDLYFYVEAYEYVGTPPRTGVCGAGIKLGYITTDWCSSLYPSTDTWPGSCSCAFTGTISPMGLDYILNF